MKKKFYNGFLLVAMLLATVGSYVSCKDYDEEAYANMLGANSKLEEQVEVQVSALNEEIEKLNEAKEECEKNHKAWQEQIEILEKKLQEEYVTLEEYKKHLKAFEEFKTENEAQHAVLEEMIKTLEKTLTDAKAALESKITEELVKVQNELNIQITALQTELTTLSSIVENNKIALEEAIAKNKADIEANKAAIEESKKKLSDLEDTMEKKENELLAAIEAGDKAVEEKLRKEIEDLENKIETLESAMSKQMEQLGLDIIKLEEELREAIANGDADLKKDLEGQINALKDALNKDINDIKETIEENYKKLDEAIAAGDEKLAEQIETINKTLESAIANIAKTNEELNKVISETIPALEERVAANEKTIESLNTSIESLNTELGEVKNLLNETIQDVIKANTLAENNSKRIDALVTTYEELQDDLKKLEDTQKADKAELLEEIEKILAELSEIKATADEALKIANDNLQAARAYTDEQIAIVTGRLNNIDTTLENIQNAYQAADKELQDEIEALKKNVNALETLINENQKKIEKLVEDLTKDFVDLKDKVDNIEESLAQYVSGIILQRAENPVFGSYSLPANIQTNVLMAYYGYAEGNISKKVPLEFPTYWPRFYVRDTEALTPEDIEMLGVKPEKLAEKSGAALVGSAGKVYVTVNPSNVNFEGQTLPIVNSLDEESGIKLTGLKYSDKKLTFGASTRAAVNGFYEAEATLAPADINKVKMTFDLNVGELKETVKDIINPLDGINVSQVASTVFDVLGQFNLDLDANALKASWTDELGVTRNVYSNYNLATTAVKPLSYAFMKDAHFESFPGFDKMRNFAGKLLDKIANKFKVVINKMPSLDLDTEKIDRIEFKDININTEKINVKIVVDYLYKTTIEIDLKDYIDLSDLDLTIDNYTVDVEVPVTGDVYDNFGNLVGTLTTTVTEKVTIPSEEIKATIDADKLFKKEIEIPIEVPVYVELEPEGLKDLLAEVEVMEDEINEMLGGSQDRINKVIDKVNSYLAKLEKLTAITDKIAEIGGKVDGVKDNLKGKIISFLDKVEGKLLAGINSINKAVQPVMLVKTSSSFQTLSQTIYKPTVMSSGDVQFIPTSYTAEIVAPAYKKLVGVTDVFTKDRSKSAQNGDANCLSALKAANAKAGVAEILNGDTQLVNFTAKKGYIYEVTYTSVDFCGMVVAKKYYVTVK